MGGDGDINLDAQSEANEEGADGDELTNVHARAMERFTDLVPPQLLMRAQSLAARRFVSIPGAQWEGWFGDWWGETIKLEIPLVKRGMQKIERDYRSNRLAVNFRAASGDASAETANTLDGIYRADDYHFKSRQARDNAFSEALGGGFGAYRVVNAWADPYDKDSDAQRINPADTIVDADQSVFFDPNAKLYDKADAMFGYVLTSWIPGAYCEKFNRAAPTEDDAKSTRIAVPERYLSTWDNNLVKPYYDWYAPQIVRTCEYYEVEEVDELLYVFTQPLSGDEERWFESQIEPGDIAQKKALGFTVRTRTVKRRRVHKYTMSGSEILEDNGYIAGSLIPIVPVYYNRYFVDNMERWTGYVSDRIDIQRAFNTNMSKDLETDALAPREVPIFAAQQMPTHISEFWKNQNVERHPYAIVEPLIDPISGQYVSLGPIGKIEPPQISPVRAMLTQQLRSLFDEDNQDGADEVKSNTSAEAMDLAATRIDAKSELPIDNMRQSVQREGEIYLSQAADVYYEPDREVDTLSEDGEDGTATLVESQTDKNSGIYEVHNDFARGKYKVISDVTEATSTRRDKTVKAALNGAQIAGSIQNQQAASVCLAVAFMNMDGEGTDVLQKFGRQQLVSMGLVEPNDEEKAQIAQAAQNKQPDPTEALAVAQAEALGAQGQKDMSAAVLNMAKTGQTKADAILKLAQAQAIGGPDQVPTTPTGLTAPDPAKQVDQIASAKLKSAQADKIKHDIGLNHLSAAHGIIKDHHDMIMDHATHGLAIRQQDHAESQPVNDRSAA